ncbi:MAG: hypothetical protein ACC628_00840 [Pirellulaceae bacterium]
METERLHELIDQKKAVLSQVLQLARRQVEFIQSGDMGHLLGLLAVKQKLLQQLRDIEQQLDPFRSQDPEQRKWQSPDARQQTQQAAQQCEALLADIMQLEKQCESDLIHRRDAAGERLLGVHSATQAKEAYASTSSRHRGHLDLTSET